MDKQLISERVENIASRIAAATGVELVHVEIAGTRRDVIVRIYIDKQKGVTIDDCSAFSRTIEEVLETEDFVPSKYVLEVSSPGIERELYSIADFAKFTGHLAKVKTNVEIDGQKTFIGTIAGVDDDTIIFEDRGTGNVSFKYSDVAKANLKIDLAKEFGRSK